MDDGRGGEVAGVVERDRGFVSGVERMGTVIDQAKQTTTLLNRLLQTLFRSLPLYLADARPWVGRDGEELQSVLTSVALDYRSYIERLADTILDLGGPLEVVGFPTEFTDLHDLSVDYLLTRCIELQRRDVGTIECCVEGLLSGSAPRLLAEEVLGNARGHLERMLHPHKTCGA